MPNDHLKTETKVCNAKQQRNVNYLQRDAEQPQRDTK